MRDAEIREALLRHLGEKFPGDRIRPEMGLCLGATRVDVAVINGHLHGYEIKSERDSLARLDNQVDLYGRVLDYATVVAGGRHVERVLGKVPPWWGLTEAVATSSGVIFRVRRRPERNRELDALAIAQLLWREEAAEILRARGETVTRRETRWHLWDRIAQIPLSRLQRLVRDTLKARPRWPTAA